MSADPSPRFRRLPAPETPAARHRCAVAALASAVVLEREGQAEAAAALRVEAALFERSAQTAPSCGDAA